MMEYVFSIYEGLTYIARGRKTEIWNDALLSNFNIVYLPLALPTVFNVNLFEMNITIYMNCRAQNVLS